jgi:cbb3-type cytochrome oxidase maturation protein
MESLFLLIPLAILFTVLIGNAFFWAVNHRQFDDLDHAGDSILYDDDIQRGDTRAEESRHD